MRVKDVNRRQFLKNAAVTSATVGGCAVFAGDIVGHAGATAVLSRDVEDARPT